jgi:hypothetical protein
MAKVCATVMRASSCVSLASLFSMISISLSPNNFFANCSATRSESVTHDDIKTMLTESSSADLFLRNSKYQNQLDHYFGDNIRHQRVQANLCMNMETFEEVSDTLKEFEEGVIARAHSVSGLSSFKYQIDSASEEGRQRTVKRTSIPTKMSFAGWNGIWWRKSN